MPALMDAQTTNEIQIVNFEDEGPHPVETLASRVEPPSSALASARETRDHSIKDIVGRPYYMYTTSWHIEDQPGAQLAHFILPADLLAVPTVKEKLQGFAFFRGGVKLTIEVNAQPFQQGRLIAVFHPGITDTNAVVNLTHLTGYPLREIDIQTAQTMSIDVPFVAPVSHINLVKSWGNIGSVSLYVYGQLAGGTTEVEIAFWLQFTDPDPQVPTAVLAQGLGIERSKASNGPISQVATSVSSIAKIASAIPGIGVAAGVVNTVSSAVASVASIFGWSKPINENPVALMQQNPGRYFNNFNGMDNSKTLALDHNNAIEQYEGLYGSKVDEMSLQYIVQTPNYFRTVKWTTTAEAGSYITTIPVHPNYYSPLVIDSTSLPPTQYRNPTHLSFVCSSFSRWRGDITFRFKFVKTKFHSGRLRISFIPQLDSVYDSLPVLDLNRAYSTIIDIRNRSEFDFEVPFVYPQPWADCSNPQNTLNPNANPHLGLTGFVVVDVINKLVAPSDIVSPSIDLIIEVCAGKDFEVAVPKQPYYAPVPYPLARRPPPPIVKAQSLFLESRSEAQTTDSHTPLFETQRNANEGAADALSIGERIVSLRQLFQRFQIVSRPTTPTTPTQALQIIPMATVNPPKFYEAQPALNYMDYFLTLYAFYRGSMRTKIIANYDTRMINQVGVSLYEDYPLHSDTVFESLQTKPTGLPPQTVHFPSLEGIVENSIPFYNSYSLNYTPFYQRAAVINTYDAQAFVRSKTPGISIDNVPVNAGSSFSIARAIGEDFTAGFLLGAPLCIEAASLT